MEWGGEIALNSKVMDTKNVDSVKRTLIATAKKGTAIVKGINVKGIKP